MSRIAPVELVVVAVNTEQRLAFANNPEDSGDGVLLLMGNREVPVVTQDSSSPSFTGEKMISPPLPSQGQRVICIVEAGRKGKLRAQSWATVDDWENAQKRYAVLCDTPDSEDPQVIWEGVDLLKLSKEFHTNSWDTDGVILRRPNGNEYYIVEVVEDPTSTSTTGHDITPVYDPRIPIHHLDPCHYGPCKLPQD